jgi:hypothetical protein
MVFRFRLKCENYSRLILKPSLDSIRDKRRSSEKLWLEKKLKIA